MEDKLDAGSDIEFYFRTGYTRLERLLDLNLNDVLSSFVNPVHNHYILGTYKAVQKAYL